MGKVREAGVSCLALGKEEVLGGYGNRESLRILRMAKEEDGHPAGLFILWGCREEAEEGRRSLWVSALGWRHAREERRGKASTEGQEFPFGSCFLCPPPSLDAIPFCPHPIPHLLSVTLPWTWPSRVESAANTTGSGIIGWDGNP